MAAARLKRRCLNAVWRMDPDRFDADPVPTLRADADPDPKVERENEILRNRQLFFPKSYKTCHG